MLESSVIIVGNGPAGVSTALYTARAGIETLVIGSGEGALMKAKEVENYYGFPNPISGQDLLIRGIAQIKRLGVKIIEQEVVGIEEADGFIVKTATESFVAKVVVLTTGTSHAKPKWQGIDIFNGMGVSYCAVCDGFFFRGKNVAVAGNGPYALHEVNILLPIADSVTLCTDGNPLLADFPPEVKIIDTPVASLAGDTVLSGIRFKDDSVIAANCLFVALGTAGSSDLALTMGAEVKDSNIVIDEHMRTNIPGLLAAGDCTGGMKQIAKAVYEGAVAGTEAVRILRAERRQ